MSVYTARMKPTRKDIEQPKGQKTTQRLIKQPKGQSNNKGPPRIDLKPPSPQGLERRASGRGASGLGVEGCFGVEGCKGLGV